MKNPLPVPMLKPKCTRWSVPKQLLRRSCLSGVAMLVGVVFLLFGIPSSFADQDPPGCEGSGLGILLFTSASDVHVGNTLTYSVTVFNGTTTGPIVCDATSITASLVTPDGVSHPINLGANTNLVSGQSDYYPNVVSYTVRAQDIQPDGTVDATASDSGVIHQNTIDSEGGGNQGVNTVVSKPCIAINAACVNAVGETGVITFSGTVTNCGNDNLFGVGVTNMVNGTPVQVAYYSEILTNSSASFSGSYTPASVCTPTIATVTAYATDSQTTYPTNVMSSTTLSCGTVLNPGINVTKTCPVSAVAPGQLLTYSGTVSNTGNVTLTGVVVVDSYPVPDTQIFTVASLAPGASANFTGSYVAPTNCSVSDTVTASGVDTCGVSVNSSAFSTCPIVTTPQILVTANCTGTPVPGGSVTYSGTVVNTGNIGLTNVVVYSDMPAANTRVYTIATLAPGASTNFTGSYPLPANTCSITTTLNGVGYGSCGLIPVTNTVAITCGVATAPSINVTLNCPGTEVAAGGLITYSGTVRNTGNNILANVYVVNSQPYAGAPVIGPITLAAGAATNFTTSFTAPADACSVSSTVTALGNDNCSSIPVTNYATATCPLITAPAIAITQTCPLTPAVPGGLLVYSGTVTNTGNVTLTNVSVMNNLSGGTPVFTIATLAPGVGAVFTGSYLAPTNCSSTSVSTVTAQSHCGATVSSAATSTCPINTTPVLNVTENCPLVSTAPGAVLTYSGTVTNAGNITLTNIVVVSSVNGSSPIFRAATLIPGEGTNFTGSYLTPTNCSSTSILTASGASTCGLAITNTAATTCTIITTPQLKVTQNCPVGTVVPGGVLTFSGSVTNTGNITITNVVVVNDQGGQIFTAVSLAPGVGASFTGSYVAPNSCSSVSTSTATGVSACGVPVTASATTTCPITTTPQLILTQSCPFTEAVPGGLFTYIGSVSNSGNIVITNVVIMNSLVGSTPVYTTASLVPGQVTTFTGSFLTPTNCTVASVSTATGVSICGAPVSTSLTSTCPVNTTPVLNVTENCPLVSTAPGAVLTFSGTVTNAGNISLTNIVVVSSVNGTTPIFRAVTLVPGEGTNFTGSYITPTNCSSTSILTASGASTCGVDITNTAAATCSIITTPQLSVTQTCPSGAVVPGGLLTFNGTVTNTGNITITNVSVVNDMSGVIFTTVSLAPHTGSSFTGSYLAPTNCSVTSTSTASGLSVCGVPVTAAVSSTCPILTTPQLTINQSCSGVPAVPGGLVTYTGTIGNIGNITLTNVVVLNNLSGGSPIFTVATLAPGVTAAYSGSYLAPTNCSSTSVSTVSGESVCGVTASASASSTCTILTTPVLNVTETCPVNPTVPGQLLQYSGTLTNAGNITLTNVVVLNNLSGGSPIFRAAILVPGEGTNYTGSYLTPTNCSSTSFVTASAESTCGMTITNQASASCAIINTPQLRVTQSCPPSPVTPGALLTFSGTVTNTGNITITNVTVLNSQSGIIFTAASLAPGTGASYTGSYVAPASCSSTSTSTAIGVSVCGATATNSATTTCTIITTPQLVITEACPANPAVPGGLLTYSGSVSNSGNILITNVVVLNNQSGGTPVFTTPTLAPGQVVAFTGSYVAPTNCSSTSTSTVTGQSICGVTVSASSTATCPILTTPMITVTETCPSIPVPPGGVLTFSGSVSNSGNITLTNIIVVSDRPAANTTIFKAVALAPGATTNFTGSYQVPLNCCVVFSTASVTAQGCSGQSVNNSYTSTCTVQTQPSIVVTKTCPGGLLQPGDLLTYSGSVSNSGNITLVNVMVADSEALGNPPFSSPIDLAPGQSVTFSGSYTVPPDFCGTDTILANAQDVCTYLPVTNSMTTTCPITTSPAIKVSLTCPPVPTPRGGLFTYTGSVSNAGNVSLVGVYVTDDEPSNNAPVVGPLTLAPGATVDFTNSYVAPTCCCLIIDTLTATGKGYCNGSNVTATSTAVCPLLTLPGIAVVENCPPSPIPMGGTFGYSGYVTNTGDVDLTNVVVYGPLGTNNVIVGPISLAPATSVSYSGSYTAGFNASALTVLASGQETCGGTVTTNSASCIITPTPQIDPVNNATHISFPSTTGKTYTVEYKNTLTDTNWISLPGVSGTGAVITITDTNILAHPTRFYRVMVTP